MTIRTSLAAVALMVSCSAWAQSQPAPAQPGPVSLSAYADKNGFINVQALTCAQLANTYQEDADMLMTWYSGWYNGLAKKHYFHMTRGIELEHEVIVYCKANPKKKIIQAISVIFKDERSKKAAKTN